MLELYQSCCRLTAPCKSYQRHALHRTAVPPLLPAGGRRQPAPAGAARLPPRPGRAAGGHLLARPPRAPHLWHHRGAAGPRAARSAPAGGRRAGGEPAGALVQGRGSHSGLVIVPAKISYVYCTPVPISATRCKTMPAEPARLGQPTRAAVPAGATWRCLNQNVSGACCVVFLTFDRLR